MNALIIPKGNSLIAGINSYYVDIAKFLEHYTETSFSGTIHFKSYQSEGVVFLDEENVLSGMFQDQGGYVEGQKAVERIVASGKTQNYIINLVELDADKVYFWTSLTNLEKIHSGLSSEFTDLEALVNKMSNEALTGYIEVIQNDTVKGYVFFLNGTVLPDAYEIGGRDAQLPSPDVQSLVELSRANPSLFNVARVPSGSAKDVEELPAEPEGISSDTLEMLEALLHLLQSVIESNRRIRVGFDTILRKKFMEKVDMYEFLDPFAAEFVYENGRITYAGDSGDEELAHGVLDCVREIASETGTTSELARNLSAWKDRYAEEIGRYGLVI